MSKSISEVPYHGSVDAAPIWILHEEQLSTIGIEASHTDQQQLMVKYYLAHIR